MNTIVRWFVDNPIAANLLMLVILLGGIKSLPSLSKEVFPRINTSTIEISAIYPGASPSEVERQIVIRLEEAVADLAGIDELNSTARLGSGSVFVEVVSGYDSQRLLNNIKSRIDALSTLPDEVEDVQVKESLPKHALMSVALFGDVEERLLKQTALWVRDELALLDSVSTVDIEGTRKDEMAIEVSELALRHYNLRFDDITRAIRNASLNLPAGTVKGDTGNIQVQTRGQAYTAEDFNRIVIASRDDGAQLTLGQVATVNDGFNEVDLQGNFNGSASVYVELYATTPPDILASAADAKAVIERLRPQLPEGVSISVWRDWSTVFKSRMNLLVKNALSGLVLVFIVLMLFLRPSLAGWVSAGIAIAFFGVFWVLPYTDVTLNMLSMFGFLLALGIVVDDAIVVGESIYASQRRGETGLNAAKYGALFVTKPVLFAVISTIIFFCGIFGLPGVMGDIVYPVPVIVILCLVFSLIESLLILPSHLSHAKPEKDDDGTLSGLTKVRYIVSRSMEQFAATKFRRLLDYSLKHNAQTIMLFVVSLAVVVTLYSTGYLKSTFRPQVPSNNIRITAELAEGTSFAETKRIQQQIERAAYQLKIDPHMIDLNGDGDFIRAIKSTAEDNVVKVVMALVESSERSVNILQTKERWQQLIGPLSGVKDFNLSFTINAMTEAIRFRVSTAGNDLGALSGAVTALRQTLESYDGVFQVEDTLEGSRKEIELRLKPHAEVLGLTLSDIARQVRQGFYGEEVQRIPRGTEDVKVMVRYPLVERSQIDDIATIYIRTEAGHQVPLGAVAEIVEIPGYSKINRENRRRTILVSAEVTKGTDALAIATDIIDRNLSNWQQQFRGLQLDIAGDLNDQRDFMLTLATNLIAAIFISYGLMAIGFRSLWQPLLILTAIPFGFAGAVIGHLIMGQSVSMLSMLGFLACSGVVVNDNLVLLDRIQQLRAEGGSVVHAIVQAGQDRFRAIILTSITTFVGLVPIMAETSVQAQFLIPMVVSLSFGVLFATAITLLLVPNLFLLGERFIAWRNKSQNRINGDLA